MLGSKVFEISAEQMARFGMSSSTEADDGAFSPDTDAVNLKAVPGAIYSPASPTDKSTNLVGEIIASSEDPSGTFSRIVVSSDTDQDGRVFSLSTSNDLTLIGSEDTTANYIQGRTDAAAYKGEVYISSASTCRRVNDISGTPTLDAGASWPFTYASATAPHPLQVFEDNLYHGDGNLLLRQTSVGDAVAPATVLTLPTGSVIVALGIDPGSGKLLISYVGQFNVSGTVNTQARVGFYDGFSNKLLRSVIVEEMITAFPTSEGTQYVAYGKNLGYWNGSGAKFLRAFPSIGYDNTELLYKHHFASIGSDLYFIVDTQIICHGSVEQGRPKIFYPAFKNNVNSNNLTHIANIGSGVLGMSFSSAKFYTWDSMSVASTNTMSLHSAWLRSSRPIQIRGIHFEWSDSVSNGATPGVLTYVNRSIIGSSGAFNSMGSLANSSGSAIRETHSPIIGLLYPKGTAFKFRYNADTTNTGLRRIRVHYDTVE